MNRSSALLALALLLLVELQAPVAHATQAGDTLETATISDPGLVPDQFPIHTGIVPVDRTLDDAANQTRRDVGTGFSVIGSTLNTVRGTLPPPAVRLYADGTGSDPRAGGFGDWQVVSASDSDPTWGTSHAAAQTGNSGFTTASRPDGTYPFGARTMLVSPELDLHGLAPETAHPADPSGTLPPIPGTSDIASAVWRTVFNPNPSGIGALGTPLPIPLPGRPPADASVELRFAARYNLATGRDSVQVVLWRGAPPTEFPTGGIAAACLDPSTLTGTSPTDLGPQGRCKILDPGAFAAGGNSYDGDRRFTGSSDNATDAGWLQYRIDLTPWMGQSVWVSFAFVSGTPVAPTEAWGYSPALGFLGFQLDNLELTATAMPHSLRVHAIDQPSTLPLDCAPSCRVAIPPGQPFQVHDLIQNVGFLAQNVTATVQLLDDKEGATTCREERHTAPFTLAPGEILEVNQSFAGLPLGAYQATVTIARGPSTGSPCAALDPACPDGAGGTRVSDAEGQTACTLGAGGEADTSDDHTELGFDVAKPRNVLPGALQRSAPTIANGDSLQVTLPLENAGVGDASAHVDACLVDWTPYLDLPSLDLATAPAPTCSSTPLANSDNFGQGGSNVAVALPGRGHTSVVWDVRPPAAGQYKLFVHGGHNQTSALEAISLDKLLPAPQRPLQPTYRSDPAGPAGSDQDVSKGFWTHVPATPIQLWDRNPNQWATPSGTKLAVANAFQLGDQLPGKLQLANNATNLFLRITLPKTDSVAGNDIDPTKGSLAVLFDDHGDRRANATDDGARLSGGNVEDLHYDNATQAWVPDAHADGTGASWQASVVEQGVSKNLLVYEFIRPLHGSDGQDLAVDPAQPAPKDLLGFTIQATIGLNGATLRSYSFPALAAATDGGGLLAKNGVLDDEMKAWQMVRLAAGPPAVDADAFDLVSPGFGVDRNPPPVFQEDAGNCNAWSAWSQSDPAVVTTAGVRREKWVCAPYGDDGRARLFEGTSPDSTCGAQACPQSSFSRLAVNPGESEPSQPDRHELYSPPIQVPNVDNPYLILDHQYATQAWIVDTPGYTEPHVGPNGKNYFAPTNVNNGASTQPTVVVSSAGRVLMETLDPATGLWGSRVTLSPDGPAQEVPDGGYSSEASLGVQGPSPRLLYYGWSGGDTTAAPTGAWDSWQQSCQNQLTGATPCAFWWPTGFQPLYQPAGAPRATGGVFSGSPWRVDRFPLFGVQPQFHSFKSGAIDTVPEIASIQAAGKTVRFVFQFFPSGEPSADDPYLQWARDYGWRIGGMAVQEGARFARDVAVANLTLDNALFDPVQAGVGPNTTLHVRIGVRNNGYLASGPLQVTLRGRNLAAGAAGPAFVCEATTLVLPFQLAPGAKGTSPPLDCPIPATADGEALLLEASVGTPGGTDDFPVDNVLSAPKPYAIHAAPDVAAHVETTGATGAVGEPRVLLTSIENRGNVPVSGLSVTRTILADSGVVLSSRHWTLAKTLGVGQSAWVADLQPREPLTAADGAFTPQTAGRFRVVLTVHGAGDVDAGDDSQSIPLEASETLYHNTFDTDPVRDPAAVQNDMAYNRSGVWRVVTDPQAGSKVLRAGDPATNEIPANTSAIADLAVVDLATVDLTTVKGATLSFNHHFDLESGFDAGRVEICTAGAACTANGTAWRPLVPDPAPLAGLPDGYPSLGLVAGPFLDGQPERPAAAYTGRSADLPGADANGWIHASFNLGRDPGMRQAVAVDAFSLAGMASKPGATPVANGPDNQFRDPSWVLKEPDASAQQRQWWVQDEAYDVAPHSGQRMWWSGAATGQAVNTTLDFTFPQDKCRPAGKVCTLTWWEWRAGSGDGDPLRKEGSGGLKATTFAFPDRDHDGLYDGYEQNATYAGGKQTSPDNPNSDGDAWGDGQEVWAKRLNPASPADPTDPAAQPQSCATGVPREYGNFYGVCTTGGNDGDGLPDVTESKLGTNPNEYDTDRDGLPDGLEVNVLGSNPLDPDLGPAHSGIVRSEPSGWVQRSVDVTKFYAATPKQNLTFRFTYDTDVAGGVALAQEQKDYGFFVDDLQLTSYDVTSTGGRAHPQVQPEQAIEDLHLKAGADPNTWTAGDWTVMVRDPANTVTATQPGVHWSLVGPGSAADPRGPGWHVDANNLGWHVEDAVVPGKGPVAAWRFGDGSGEQGYPRDLDVRLVTPLVDLSKAVGGNARLQFDQRYGFESTVKCPQFAASCPGDPGRFVSAIDGGAVEVQVYDPATGSFGPWQQLDANFRSFPGTLAFSANDARPAPSGKSCDVTKYASATWPAICDLREPDQFAQDPACATDASRCPASLLAATGYSAIAERGDKVQGARIASDNLARRDLVHGGTGTSFEAHNGTVKRQWPCSGNACPPGSTGVGFQMNWAPYPVSYVFSGDSGGWKPVDWDISPLLGQKVRFAFHAASNPSFHGASTQYGWSVANLAVTSEIFKGAPAQLRLHLATDGSKTKGEWSLDDVRITGQRYTHQLAVLPTAPASLRLRPSTAGAPLSLEVQGTLANLGTGPETNLALAVQAVDDKNHAIPATIVEPAAAAVPATHLPPTVDGGVGPFSLAAPGSGSTTTPETRTFRVRLPVLDHVGQMTVRVFLLQDNGTRYGTPKTEAPGAAAASWTFAVEDSTRLVPVPPVAGRASPMVVSPATPTLGQPATFTAGLANNGTQEPDVAAQWTFSEVLRKGSPGQPYTKESIGAVQANPPVGLGVLRSGHSTTTQATFTPPRPGLYRAQVEYRQGSRPLASTQLEVLVGTSGTYYGVDFGNATQALPWKDASPAPIDGTRGGSPPALQFREEGGSLVWGVSERSLFQGIDYCKADGAACNIADQESQNSQPKSADYRGLEGVGTGPLVDLGRVPQGSAVVTLQHRPNFEPGDGGRLEAIPYRFPLDPAAPQAAYTCPGGSTPMWFVVQPEAPLGERAFSIAGTTFPTQHGNPPTVTLVATPNQIHPLDPDGLGPASAAIVGGQGQQQDTRFRLDLPATSVCDGTRVNLVNYTVAFRLHTGTRPGYTSAVDAGHERQGRQGWQVQALDVASAGLEVSPTSRILPLEAGAAKQFALEVRNAGQQPDTFLLGLDAQQSLLPAGARIAFPQDQAFLEPGASRGVPFTVEMPPGTPSGNYLAVLAVRSASVPGLVATSQVVLALQTPPLSDLAASLTLEADGTPPAVEAGRVYSVHATVFNLGQKASDPVMVNFYDVDPTGAALPTLIDHVAVPALCSASASCIGGGRFVATVEWLVGGALGTHVLRAVADPDGKLVEAVRANNVAELPVTVAALALPDLAVTGLQVTGLGSDGLAEEGTFLGLNATVANLGPAAAHGAHVSLSYGSAVFPDTILDFAPGQSHTVGATIQATPGQTVVEVQVTRDPRERRADNNILHRLIRTRGHSLNVTSDPAVLEVAPGGVATVRFQVASNGTGVDHVTLRLADAPDWGLAVEPNPLVVAPHGTASALATLKVPANAPAGDGLLHLRAEPLGNPGAALAFALPIKVATSQHAPLITAPEATLGLGAGNLTVAVTSQSNVPQRLNLTLDGLAWGVRPVVVNLPAMGNATVAFPVRVPAGAAPGPHSGVLQLRVGKTLLAQANLRVTVAPAVLASAHWVGGILPGGGAAGERALRMSLLVQDDGNVPLLAEARPGALGEGLQLDGPQNATAVPVGGGSALPIRVRVAPDAPDASAGSVEVWVRPTLADAFQRVATVRLPRLEAAPDLHVARIDRFPAAPQAGDPVRIRIQVENLGPVAAPASRLEAFVNGDLLDDPLLPAVPPGESRTVEVNATFERPGAFLVTALADGLGAVPELQEANNGASQVVEVHEAPLLSVRGAQRVLPAPAAALPLLLVGLLALAGIARRRRA